MKATKKPAVTVRPAPEIAERLDYDIVEDRQIKFTRDRAFAFLELATFQGERSVNERHVQFLFNQWSSGRFMWEHVLIATCEFKENLYRINGQHTCWMRVNLDEDYFVSLGSVPMVREIVYRVTSEEGLRGLYATFDQNKTRTPGHMLKALLIGKPSTSDLWTSMVPKLGQALKLWLFENPKDRQMVSASDVAAMVDDKYSGLFKIVGLFCQKHYQPEFSWMLRSPVVAAQLACFNVEPSTSAEFWEPVFSGLKLDVKSDPRYQLRKYLMTHRQTAGEMEIASAEDIYRVCILAYNKWRKGESCATGLRPTDKRHRVSK